LNLKIGVIHVPVLTEPIAGDEADEVVLGEYTAGPNPCIRLHPALKGPELSATLMHEVLHAIADLYGLDDVLKEREVRILEMAICTFVKDNPQAISQILNDLVESSR
jgi:hypothetical protein